MFSNSNSDDSYESSSDDFYESDESVGNLLEDNWDLLIADLKNKQYNLPSISSTFLPLEKLTQMGVDELTKLLNKSLDFCDVDLRPASFMIVFLNKHKMPFAMTITTESLAKFLYNVLRADIYINDNTLGAFAKFFTLVKMLTKDYGKTVLSAIIEKFKADAFYKTKLALLYSVIFNPESTCFFHAAKKIDGEEIRRIREKLNIDLEEAFSIRELMKSYPLLSLESACGIRKNKYGLFPFIDSPKIESKTQKHSRNNSM